MSDRKTEAEVDGMFVERWSPRAFLPDPVPERQVKSLLEAARWAPSCFNEQPWKFLYAVKPEDRERFLTALVEKNQAWAKSAPLLIFVLVRKNFSQDGRVNRHAAFDSGAAWMSLALQARKLGLYAHAMAGFSVRKAYEVLGVSELEFDVMAAVAVGKRGDPSMLPPAMQAYEKPNDRKPLAEVGEESRR